MRLSIKSLAYMSLVGVRNVISYLLEWTKYSALCYRIDGHTQTAEILGRQWMESSY